MELSSIKAIKNLDVNNDSKISFKELKKADLNNDGLISITESNKVGINKKDIKEINYNYTSHKNNPSSIVFDFNSNKNSSGFSVSKVNFKSKNGAEITMMKIDPEKVDIKPIYGDGTDTISSETVKNQPNLLGAINGPLFGPITKVMGDMLAPGKNKYDDGYQYTNKTYHIAITKNGKLEIAQGGLPADGEKKYISFSGGMQKIYTQIDKNGKPIFNFDNAKMNITNAPNTARTLVGITKNNKVIFVTIGKGSKGHTNGSNMEEASEIMHKLGAIQAFNYDGGGSTHMIIPGSPSLSSSTDGRQVKGYIGVFKKP